MKILLDTNVLVRLANESDSRHLLAGRAIIESRRRGEVPCVTPQVLIEFRSVATRPKQQNGLGLRPDQAEGIAALFESMFVMLPDNEKIFTAWNLLVSDLEVIGKQVHDARLVALCQVHEVSMLMSFNRAHFSRYLSHVPGLVVLDPEIA